MNHIMKKVIIFFFVTKAIHKIKKNCDRKSPEKMFNLYDCMKDKIVRESDLYGSTQVEPNLSGTESDMYTVHARSKLCPCVKPRTRVNPHTRGAYCLP